MGIDRGQGTPVSSNPLELDNDDYSSTVVGPQGPKGDNGDITPEYTQMYNDTIAAKNTAASKASEASDSAYYAATSETNANTSANAASTSATSASNSASDSATSETNAATSETNAASSASSASTSATSASTSATAASGSATTATTKASEAATSASSALTYKNAAEAAKTAAETAETNAETAQSAAESARDTAEDYRDELTTLTTSTSTLSAGSSATSSYDSGTGVLSLGIPIGDTGSTGDTGPQGPQGATGATGPQGPAGSISAGGTLSGDLDFDDNVKAKFGASDDLQIYHDGSHSQIRDAGTGNLYIKATSGVLIQDNDTGTNRLTTSSSGPVYLYHSGNLKLATTSTGVDVSGTVTADKVVSQNGTIELDDNGSHNGIINAPASLYVNFDSDNNHASEKIVFGYDRDATSGGTNVMEINTTGIDVTGNVNLPDNGKLVVGDNNELQIFTNGGTSYIHEVGANDLYIKGSSIYITDSDNNQFIHCNDTGAGGAVLLKHTGSTKLVTTSTGIDVTGTVTADNFRSDSANTGYNLLARDDANVSTYIQNGGTGHVLQVRSGSMSAGQGNLHLQVANNGDISFYEDTGTTPKFYWDASAESLGIGTSSPSSKLHVQGTSFFFDQAVFDDKVGIGTSSPSALLHVDGSAGDLIKVTSPSVGTGYIGVETGYTYINANTGGASLRFETQGAERMRIDSSGRVGIGTTSPSTTLDVYGSASIRSGYNLTWGGAYGANIPTIYGVSGANSYLAFNPAGTSGTAMRIDSSGNVGIGTSSFYSGNIVQATNNRDSATRIGADNQSNTANALAGIKLDAYGGGWSIDVPRSTNFSNPLKFNFGSTERMRIDSSGNVLVGKTSNSIDTVGGLIRANGQIGGCAVNNYAGVFSRNSSDGDIVLFRKDGSTVGSIGVKDSDLHIGKGAVGISFDATGADGIRPFNTSSLTYRDNAIDIGGVSSRFKDGHFSGTVNANAFVGDGSGLTGISGGGAGGSTAITMNDNVKINLGNTSTTVGELYNDGNTTILNSDLANGDGFALKTYDREMLTVATVSGGWGYYSAVRLWAAGSNPGGTFHDWVLNTNNSEVQIKGDCVPQTDNTYDLGDSRRWDDIYATNGTIQTSDRNEKQDIEELTAAEQRVAFACKGLMRKFRWKSAVEEKGDDARIHFGIIAQDLQAAFEAEGLDAGRYAMFTTSTWWESDRVVYDDDIDKEYTETVIFDTLEEAPEGAVERTRMGVRYSELLAFIIAAT